MCSANLRSSSNADDITVPTPMLISCASGPGFVEELSDQRISQFIHIALRIIINAISRSKNGMRRNLKSNSTGGTFFAIGYFEAVAVTAASDLVSCSIIMERGWFPRAVPSGDGHRTARSPGLYFSRQNNH